MKICIFILFCVFNTALCDKKITKHQKKLFIPKLDNKCKNIKCSAVEEPECIRLKSKTQKNRTMHIIMINKCEMEYMKCLEGFEATIVPMKHCGHETPTTIVNNSNSEVPYKMKNDHKRSKRNVRDSPQATPMPVDKDYEDDKPSAMTGNVAYGHAMDSSSVSSQETETEDYERVKLNRGVGGYQVRDIVEKPGYKVLKFEEQGSGSSASNLFLNGADNKIKLSLGNSVNEISDSNAVEDQAIVVADDNNSVMAMDSNEPKQNQEDSVADEKEFNAACPVVCPSRDVLVCAKCQHGVYKTFSSVCHMRMFACNHKDDSIELISRYPCVLSAPFLAEEGMQPQGRVANDDDDDKILRFIICRDKERLGAVGDQMNSKILDTRCNFESKPQKAKMPAKVAVTDEYLSY